MKQFTILSILLFILTSCNMEKRLYRDGWYVERHRQYAESTASESPLLKVETIHTNVSSLSEQAGNSLMSNVPLTPDPKPSFREEVLAPVKKKQTETRKDDPKPKMHYAEARKSMAEKGCQPDALVLTTYYMAMATVFTLWIGIGFIFLLVTLLLSIFAMERAVKSGDCADENIAIVRDARRILGMICLWFLVIGILVAAFVLAILKIVAENGGM